MNGTAGFNITTVNFTTLGVQSCCSNIPAGNIPTLGSQTGYRSHTAGNCTALSVEFSAGNLAGCDASTTGFNFSAGSLYAAFGCNLTVCIDLKIPICPSNFTFRCIQGCFGSAIVIIASGVDTLFIHGSTVLAYFDSIFAEGNLVFAIFIQHQCIHSRGCGAVVSGDFGNHAVVAHFEVILVGRFASSYFSLDLPIQGSIFSA